MFLSLFSGFLVYLFSWKKYVVLSLTAFRLSFLSLGFGSLTVICLVWFYLCVFLLVFFWAFWNYRFMSFIRFGNSWPLFIQIFCSVLFFSPLLGIQTFWLYATSFETYIFFSLGHWREFSIDLSFHSLLLCCAVSYLLINPSNGFSVSFITFCRSWISILSLLRDSDPLLK